MYISEESKESIRVAFVFFVVISSIAIGYRFASCGIDGFIIGAGCK